MTLTLRIFGLELIHVELATDAPADEDDTARDLSGGTLATERIDAGPTEYLGFTNGRGDDE